MTGTPAGERGAPRTGARRSENPEEIEQDIRRTRAEMSETIDEIEYRLSPDHIKHEVRGAVRETVDEMQERFHPQRIAQRAGQNMLDTVKEHPVSALIAGLSTGYLLMKSGEARLRRGEGGYGRPPYRRGDIREWDYGPASYGAGPRSVRSYPREEEWTREEAEGAERREAETSATERTAEGARERKERASRQAQEMSERAGEWAGEAQERARTMGRGAQRRARRAQSRMETFVGRNPMMAGVAALGAGAVLGSMLPSTRTEDAWVGRTRDEFVHRAEEATEATMDRAQEAARHVAEETKHAARDVTETAKEEMGRVQDTAQEETKRQAREGESQRSKE